MKSIEEVVVDAFLPTSRASLAKDLRDRGFTQSEATEALGISQSAVSKHAHGEVATNERVATGPRVVDLVFCVGDGLVTGNMTPAQALVEAEVLIRQLEEGDPLSDLHENEMPGLASYDGFRSIHDPKRRFWTVEQARSSVHRGPRMPTNTLGLAGFILNIGSNLVELLSDADGVNGVAAIPGRIFDAEGQATVPGELEFGVNGRVVGVLFSARVVGVDVDAALSVVYDTGVIKDPEAANYECIEFDPDASTGPVRELLTARNLPETFVAYQSGGHGIGPITYILGPDAPAVADVARVLLRGSRLTIAEQSNSRPRSRSGSRSHGRSRSRSRSPSAVVQPFYTRWATLHDVLARRAPGVGSVRTEAVGVLALDPGGMVVEMGCGAGVNLPYLTERVGPEGSVVVVGFSSGILDVARERTREFPQVRPVRDDVTRPSVTHSLDVSPAAVLAIFALGMFDDPAAAISSWADLVGPDGRLCPVDLTETTDSRWRSLNPVFRAPVRITAPPEPRTTCTSPTKLLDRRLVAAYRALESRRRVTHGMTHALGFARVRVGVVE